MRRNKINLLLITFLFLGIVLGCGSEDDKNSRQNSEKNESVKKLESYTLRGLKFSYYKIPARLSKPELIKTAQKIHEQEPDVQLILVDDETGVADYIKYVQEIGKGETNAKLPKEWADKHIVANVQKLMNGKFRLYKGYGYEEIADLE